MKLRLLAERSRRTAHNFIAPSHLWNYGASLLNAPNPYLPRLIPHKATKLPLPAERSR